MQNMREGLGKAMRFKAKSGLAAAVLLALLPGCTEVSKKAVAFNAPFAPISALVIADGFSVVNTGKTVEDHVMGWIYDQDCSLVRASKGGNYCEDHPPERTIKRTVYCYKSLARVACYDHLIAGDETRYLGSRTELIAAQLP